MKLKPIIKNKRGDFSSILFVVVLIFVIGVVFFFTTHFKKEIYTQFQEELNESGYNDTEAYTAVSSFKTGEIYVWDYAFLGILMGSMVALGLTAYAIRMSPVFYWIVGLMTLIILVAGVILSNIWQDISAEPEFVDTLTYFPITNTILGSYFPSIIVAIIFISMVILFSKPPGQGEI